jgi:hypothetical protein
MTISFLISCTEDVNKKLIKGEWKGIGWSIQQGEDYVPKDHEGFSFSFNTDGTYIARFGSSEESGTYWVEREKLYTTATGKAQKMVRIMHVNDKILTIQMNRGGTLELLDLQKD